MLLKDLTTLTASLASGTLFHVEKSGKAYNIDYTKLAKAIVEEYNGSTLGGSAQTVQAAIGALNSRFVSERAGLVAASNVTLGGVLHREAGTLVVYHFIITATANIAKDTDLVTGGVAPALTANGGGFGFALNNNEDKKTRVLYLTGDGGIRCNEDIVSGETLRCEVVYGK